MTTRTETLSLAELAHEIETREDRKTDLIVHPSNLEVVAANSTYRATDAEESEFELDTEPRLTFKEAGHTTLPGVDSSIRLSSVAHDQLAGWTPIGTRYYRVLMEEQPDLWAANVNRWLDNADENKRRMLRLDVEPDTKVATLRAYLSDQYGRYEDIHLLRPVLERVKERGWEIAHCALTERRMYLRVLFPKLEGEVKVGDPVRAGATFTNSEVGLGAWRFESYIERLVCLNGMVMKDKFAGFNRRHITSKQNPGFLSASTLALEDQLFQSKVADTLDVMADREQFDNVLALMKSTTESEIEHPMEAIQVLRRRVRLTQNEATAVEGNLVRGGDSTLWGLVNALTATARDLPSFDRRAELEDQAGRLLSTTRYQRELIEATPKAA
jgi:hypothetical protein